MTRILMAVLLAAPASAAVPLGCTGSATLGTFQLSVRPFSQGSPLPLKSVASIPAGARLIWNPVHLPPQASSSAEVAAVLVPDSGGVLITLEPRKAAARTEWQLIEHPQVIALVYGPQGLSENKINTLVTRNRDLLRQLAEYAEQSSQVESLVQELADAEQSGNSADGALKGFSSQYGASPQKLDPKSSSDQQATLLLKTVLPTSNTYDPLASSSAQAQQSVGLAASVASMFFGNPVGLAAGGAALFQNLKTSLFPNTEFRSAFEQSADKDQMAFCTKSLTPKSKTRAAYLWAYSVPELKKPVLSLAGEQHLPLGSKSQLALDSSSAKELGRARDWRLIPISGGNSIPVAVEPKEAGMEIDLSKVKTSAGEYRLAATWDWDPLPVSGTLDLQPAGDFAYGILAPAERDKLIEGSSHLALELSGTDFEFLEKAALESTARNAKPVEIDFTLPLGKRAGPQNSATLNIDAPKQGSYRLLLTQADGIAHTIPLTILPPDPQISNLPIRLNMGEAREAIRLLGSGMERIEGAASGAGEITGAPDAHGWTGEIVPRSGLTQGRSFPLFLEVEGLDHPVAVPDAIQVVGPRPKILSVQKSLAAAPGIEVGENDLPAGTAAGLELTVDPWNDTVRPRLELGCETGELRQALSLLPGETIGGATLTSAGPRALYLSLDPGAVGYPGCRLTATVTVNPEGRSNRFILGRVVRVPHLDKFTLTTEKIGDAGYTGILEGHDLDVIEKAGWDVDHGIPVKSIPTPVPGDASRQMLRAVLPWPAPAPHAPLYVWLRGEAQGRKTAVVY